MSSQPDNAQPQQPEPPNTVVIGGRVQPEISSRDAYTSLSSAYRLYFPDPRTTRQSTQMIQLTQIIHTSHMLTSFTIFPVNAHQVATNRLLWQTVQHGYVDAEEGIQVLKSNVITLGVPPQLHTFLSEVTMREMYTAMTDFLVLMYHQLMIDNDTEGLDNFTHQLYRPVLQHVLQQVREFPRGEPEPGRRADLLEKIVQMCFLTPWKITVFGAYTVPLRRDNALSWANPRTWSEIAHQLWAETPSYPPHTGPLVQQENSHRRYYNIRTRLNSMDEGMAVMRLHSDWTVLFKMLKCTGVAVGGITEALHRMVDSDTGMEMMQLAMTVTELSQLETSYFSWLPNDLVSLGVIPWIVRRQVESVAPRSISLSSLKSLIDRSARVFETLWATNGVDDVVQAFDRLIVSDNLQSIIQQSDNHLINQSGHYAL